MRDWNLLTVLGATIKLGSTPLLVSGTEDSKPKPPVVEANIKSNNVSIAEAAELHEACKEAAGLRQDLRLLDDDACTSPGIKYTLR